MPKAKVLSHEERLAMTKKKSNLLQSIREGKDLPPAYPGIEDLPQEKFDENHCPECGGEMTPFEGCYRCKKCGLTRCG